MVKIHFFAATFMFRTILFVFLSCELPLSSSKLQIDWILPPAYAVEWCEIAGNEDGLTTACNPRKKPLSIRLDLDSAGVSSYRAYSHAVGEEVVRETFTKPDKKRIKIQVLTDIDDTVKSSGGVKIAGVALGGIDTQYKRGLFYPGVFQFEYEIARAKINPGEKPLPVAVLTARAKELKFALELKEKHAVCTEFRNIAEKDNLNWGIGTVLYGSVREWILQNLKGERKFNNFQLLQKQQQEEIKYVFVGDTGEMDQDAGEQMIRRYPDRMLALFMHVVSEDKQVEQLPEDKKINGVPVLFFRTYVGAARKALQHGILDSRAVRRVIRRAEDDLQKLGFPTTSSKWKDLRFDINRTKQLVTKRGLEENTLKITKAAGRAIGGTYRIIEGLVSLSA